MYKLTDVILKSFLKKNISIGTELTDNRVLQKQIQKINLFTYLFSFYLVFMISIYILQGNFSHILLLLLYLSITIVNHILFRVISKIKLYSLLFASFITFALCKGILCGSFYGSGIIGTSLVILIVMNTLDIFIGSIFVIVIILTELYIYYFSSQITWIYNYSQADNILFLRYLGTQLGVFLLSYITIKNQNDLYKELQKDKDDREKLFTNIVHDLKTPLTIIHNDLDDYVEKNKNSNSAIKLKTSILKMEQNILSILNMYKSEIKNKRIEKNFITDLSHSTLDICDQFLPYSISKKIKIKTDIEQNLYSKIHDKSYHDILNNLLNNALKLSFPDSEVLVSLRLKNKYITLEVKYIATHDQSSDFDLNLAKNICSKYNLKMDINNRTKNNTAFTVLLPSNNNKTNEEKSVNNFKPIVSSISEEESALEFHKDLKTILIVEDNNDIRNLLTKNFKNKFNIITGRNGAEGLEKFYSIQSVDLILTDIVMPEMNGIDFIKEIKNNDQNKSIPVIFLTAKQQSDVILDYISLGAIDYIIKPFSIKELLVKVESILNLMDYKQSQVINSIGSQIKNYIYDDMERIKQFNNSKDEMKYTNRKFKDYLITNKEQSIITEISLGKSYKEIAYSLNISINTVNSHIHRIYKKCKVNNSASLLKIFYQ